MANATVVPDPFPITAAQLSGNFAETLFFGIYLVTCTFCARTLLLTGDGREERWLRLHEIRWMWVTIALGLFAILTFDVAIGLLHNFHAFIVAKDPKVEFDKIRDWINIARTINQNVTMIIADYVLIYRCWIVYGRRWLIIVPSIVLYLGALAITGRLLGVELSPATSSTITLNSAQIRPWYAAFFAVTAIQNVLTTGILIWRIWRVEKTSEKYINRTGSTVHQPRHLTKVMRVIGESGAAYTMMVFVAFVVEVTSSNAMYPVADMTLQMTGIAFNIILVRSSKRRDQQFTTFDNHERTTLIDSHRTAASNTLGSLKFVPGQSKTDDVELAVKTFGSEQEQSQTSHIATFPNGVKVTKSVMSSL